MVAARWSRTGAGSCSNTVTGTPRRLSASAHTMPTGPAPTTTTRAFAFGAGMSNGRGLTRLLVERDHRAFDLLVLTLERCSKLLRSHALCRLSALQREALNHLRGIHALRYEAIDRRGDCVRCSRRDPE